MVNSKQFLISVMIKWLFPLESDEWHLHKRPSCNLGRLFNIYSTCNCLLIVINVKFYTF